MSNRHRITAADIVDLATYTRERQDRRRAMIAVKKDRRLAVGPHASVHFECRATLLHQIQEMLYIEKGGDAQLEDELRAYNPLVPDGRELVATILFEIDDAPRRNTFLRTIGGVESHFYIEVGGVIARGLPEDDVERTNAEGKASSVHFIHFPMTPEQIAAFKGGARAVFGIDHPGHTHMTVLPPAVQTALAGDFD